ncbi:MAG: TolC family protein, partial [bacterium]
LSDAYGASFSDLGGLGHRVYAAGIQANVPLGGRRERLSVQAVDGELEAARAERAAMEERVRLEVQAALEQAAFARRRVEAAGRLAELSQNKLSAEEKNYARGRSSTEILIRFAEEVRQARREQLRARVDLARTALALRLASGRDLIGGAP